MKVSIYIEIKSKGNPRGEGKAEAIIEYIDKAGVTHRRCQNIEVKNDTKNSLALKICIAAMRVLKKPCEATIYIDCPYLVNICNRNLLPKWKQNEWKRAGGKQLANMGDWKQFYMLTEIHKITFLSDNKQWGVKI